MTLAATNIATSSTSAKQRSSGSPDEGGRIHGAKAPRSRGTHDDGFHTVDAVHADDLGVGHHRQADDVGVHRVAQVATKTPRRSPLAGSQHDEDAPPAPQRRGGGGERAAAATFDHQVDGTAHRVPVAGACALTRIGPLSVRRNASSWRSSAGVSRSGRRSLWPAAAAGARL